MEVVELFSVNRVVEHCEQACMNGRMKCFYSAVQYFRKARDFRNLLHRNIRSRQERVRPARRNYFHSEAMELRGKLDNSFFIGNAEKRPANF